MHRRLLFFGVVSLLFVFFVFLHTPQDRNAVDLFEAYQIAHSEAMNWDAAAKPYFITTVDDNIKSSAIKGEDGKRICWNFDLLIVSNRPILRRKEKIRKMKRKVKETAPFLIMLYHKSEHLQAKHRQLQFNNHKRYNIASKVISPSKMDLYRPNGRISLKKLPEIFSRSFFRDRHSKWNRSKNLIIFKFV